MTGGLVIAPPYMYDIETGTQYNFTPDCLVTEMENREGGVLAVYSGYEVFGYIIKEAKRNQNWRVKLSEVGKHKSTWINRVTHIYVRHISIQPPRVRAGEWEPSPGGGLQRKQIRPHRKKWTVINMREWGGTDHDNILLDVWSLIDMVEARGVSIRSTMGATSAAMVRKSPLWPKGRKAATWEMEPIAKSVLPGGHLALRVDSWTMRKAIYIDQESSHLNIAATEHIPSPERLRFRNYFHLTSDSDMRLSGLYYAIIHCEPLPPERMHLYPWWAQEPGRREVKLWSPELLLLDDYVKLVRTDGGLLSPKRDEAIREYAQWALAHIAQSTGKIRKRVLLAGVGMLGVNTSLSFDQIITGDYDTVPEFGDEVKMPLFGDGYRTSLTKRWHPAIQNPIALGVIQAWTKVRTLQLARRLEAEGVPAIQIVADAVIAGLHRPWQRAGDGSPFIPPGWKCDTLEYWRTYGVPNQVLCDNHPKTPGIPKSLREAYVADRPHVARATNRTFVQPLLDNLS